MRAALFLFLHSCLAFEVDERLKMLEGVRFSPEQKHRELLENVIEFGLNQSQYLQEIQERDLWTKGASFLSQSSSFFINYDAAGENSEMSLAFITSDYLQVVSAPFTL